MSLFESTTMIKTFFAAAAATLLLAAPMHARATVLTFDELDTGGAFASLAAKHGQYGGFTWSSSFLLGDDSYLGYDNAAHSGHNFVNNRNARTLNVSRASAFDFAGAWFVAPNLVGGATLASTIRIDAFGADGQLLGSTGDVAIGSDYRFVQAGFANVHRLSITRDAGWYAMDDFTLATPVPEPAGLLMVGLGAGALLLRRRR